MFFFFGPNKKNVRLPFAKDPISGVISDQEDADEYMIGVSMKKNAPRSVWLHPM